MLAVHVDEHALALAALEVKHAARRITSTCTARAARASTARRSCGRAAETTGPTQASIPSSACRVFAVGTACADPQQRQHGDSRRNTSDSPKPHHVSSVSPADSTGHGDCLAPQLQNNCRLTRARNRPGRHEAQSGCAAVGERSLLPARQLRRKPLGCRRLAASGVSHRRVVAVTAAFCDVCRRRPRPGPESPASRTATAAARLWGDGCEHGRRGASY